MKQWLRTIVSVACFAVVVGCSSDDDGASTTSWSLLSPGGVVAVDVAQLDLGGEADYPTGERLYYRVAVDGVEILQWSPLGIATDRADYTDALEFRGRATRRIDRSYEMAVGKRLQRRERANEITLRFANAANDEIEIEFRAADDGAAFRYRILGEGSAAAIAEISGFRLAENSRAWLLPYQNPSPFGPAYESTYAEVPLGTTNRDSGWGYAALFGAPDAETFALVAEADLDHTYAGTHLGQPVGSLYRVAYPSDGEGRGMGAVEPAATLPWTTPWRVVIGGDLPTVFESTLVDDLSRPVAGVFGGDTGWVQPGRSAWSWYSQETGDPDLQRRYIDFAASLGWEYVLVDARWDQWPNGDEDARAVVDYAAEAGVGVHLWYNSGGPHNVILTETPRDRMDTAAARRAELARIASWGVRGIKVDFFQSEKQEHIAQYLDILEDAARERLLVNFHGSTLPRGWQRTYPNLVTMEGVRGAEFYKFFDGPDGIDNVRLALTRNVIGSMDYTPVTFADALEKRGLSYAHQVALAVVFESGVQHFADQADGSPDQGFAAVFAAAPFVRDFFSAVPAVWDETLLLSGSPDSHVVVARRSGDDWYIAGINGLATPISIDVSLTDLRSSPSALRLIRSGAQLDQLVLDDLPAADGLSLEMAGSDGFVALLARE
jgi:hypothetical protein